MASSVPLWRHVDEYNAPLKKRLWGAGSVAGAVLAWIIHENIYRNGLAADGGFRRPQNPLWLPKSVLEPIQRPKRMNMQLNVAELIRQKCS